MSVSIAAALRRSQGLERVWKAATVAFLGGLFVYAVAPFVMRSPPVRTIVVYGFSILGDVFEHDLFPAFAAEWRARTGEDVELISAFAGSGTVTNQIVMGVPAEVAVLSLELDADRVAAAGATPPLSWRALPYEGVLVRTPLVIVVRRGNPLDIRGFADLERSGVRVVHPDPLTSGGALWAIMAEYGSAALTCGAPLASEQAEQAGRTRLAGIWRNVVAQAASARAARTQFENGFGDALITYEQDVLDDVRSGRLEADIVYPQATIMSELTTVVVERNVRAPESKAVRAFVDWLWTPAAQSRFVARGFRSVLGGLDAQNPAFGRIEQPFYISAFGGWQAAQRQVIVDVWRRQVRGEETL